MALPSENLFRRDDTLFGICESLGQDLGINPLWLRLAFLPFLFFAPLQTIGAYFLLGIGVWASNSLFPRPAKPQVSASETAPQPEAPAAIAAPAMAEKTDYSLAA